MRTMRRAGAAGTAGVGDGMDVAPRGWALEQHAVSPQRAAANAASGRACGGKVIGSLRTVDDVRSSMETQMVAFGRMPGARSGDGRTGDPAAARPRVQRFRRKPAPRRLGNPRKVREDVAMDRRSLLS